MLRDRLVSGINNNKFQQRLLAEGSTLTYDRALELALSLEAAEVNSSAIRTAQNVQTSGVRQTELRTQEFNGISKLSPTTTTHVSGPSNLRCDGRNHRPDKCAFKDKECFLCRSKGHTIKVCRKKRYSKNDGLITPKLENTFNKINKQELSDNNDHSDDDVYNLYTISSKKTPPLMVTFKINTQDISMEVDTGAS